MRTIEEIETAIRQLSDRDVRELVDRLQSYLDDAWDDRLKSDLESGKLDRLIAKAEADIAASRVKDLDEVIYDT